MRFMILFNGLGADLLFYIAINTIFFTTVKGLSAVDISLIMGVSSLITLLLYFPVSFLIRKIKNQHTVILKCLCFLLAAILYTFGEGLFVFIIAGILYELAGILGQVSYVILKNNLDAMGKPDKYVDVRSKCKLVYAIITCLIAVGAGYLFAYSSYLPMYLCIAFSALVLIMSLFYKELPSENSAPVERKFNKKGLFSLFMFLLLMSSILVMQNFVTIQEYAKLAIQFVFEDALFSVGTIAIILGYIIIGCRAVRILACAILPKIYNKTKNKRLFMILIPIILGVVTIIAGVALVADVHYIIKICAVVLAFYTVYALMDIYGAIVEEVILSKVTPEEKSNAMAILKTFNIAGKFITSFCAMAILSILPMWVLFVALGVLALLGTVFVAKLVKNIPGKNKNCLEQNVNN